MHGLRIESLGAGLSRIHAHGVGYADIATTYAEDGWELSVRGTNVASEEALQAMVQAFRQMEGM